MKNTFLLILICISCQNLKAQSLVVLELETESICHTFRPGDKVFIKKKGEWAYQKTAFYRTQNDSVFIRNDSFAISDIKRIIPEKGILYPTNTILSTGEVFGSAFQVFAIIFGAGNSLNGTLELDWILWGYGVSLITFAEGSFIKYSVRSLKNGLFSCFNYSSKKYMFMAN